MTMSIRTLFTACVATMLWAACDNNSLTEQAAPCEDVHIRVAAPTRAAKSDFAEGDSIGIFAVERSIEQTAALPSIRPGRANNAKWVRDAEGNWYPATVADRITWSQSGTRMDFYAYYPYDPSLTDPCSIVLNLTRQTAGSDVLRAVNSQGLTKGEVLLSFDHVLSRIDVWITGAAEGDVVRMTGARTSATMNLGTGTVTPTGGEAALTLSEERTGEQGKPHYQALLPAQTFSGQIQCEHAGATYLFDFKDLTLKTGVCQPIELTLR